MWEGLHHSLGIGQHTLNAQRELREQQKQKDQPKFSNPDEYAAELMRQGDFDGAMRIAEYIRASRGKGAEYDTPNQPTRGSYGAPGIRSRLQTANEDAKKAEAKYMENPVVTYDKETDQEVIAPWSGSYPTFADSSQAVNEGMSEVLGLEGPTGVKRELAELQVGGWEDPSRFLNQQMKGQLGVQELPKSPMSRAGTYGQLGSQGSEAGLGDVKIQMAAKLAASKGLDWNELEDDAKQWLIQQAVAGYGQGR